ncbi:MAG TPA: GNAT family N-acetyltransferase [Ktedonobacteraceae bacterium]
MALASEIGPQHLGTLWVLDLGEPLLIGPMPRVAVVFQRVGPEAAPLLAQAMGLEDSTEVLQRFAAGKRCYTVTVEGELATYGWVTFDEELIGELRLRIRLAPGEAYIWDCATLGAYRGLRLYPALLWHMINDLRAEELQRIWIGADADNLPSQTGIVLCGFQPIVDIVLDRVLAIRVSWARGCPGAPAQLVEDARRKLLGGRHEAWLAALSSISSGTTTSH